MKRMFVLLALLAFCAPRAGAATAASPTTIPFLGCIELGPTVGDGSWTAPAGRPLVTSLPPTVAARLTLYASNWSAVLAPRGWACRSSVTPLKGVAMIVAPAAAIDRGGDILNGPAIIVWNDESAATVAAYAGRYFPGQNFARAACGQHCPQPSPSLAPRYPTDAIRYRGQLVLGYMTPARHAGLGSLTSPTGGGLPVLPSYGLLGLSSLPRGAGGIVNVTLRLPPDLQSLRDPILNAFAACLPDRNTVACESGGAFVAQGHPIDDGD